MKRHALALRPGWMFFMLFAGVVYAQTTPRQQATPSSQAPAASIEQEIRAAQQQLLDAARKDDMDAARQLMAADLTWVDSKGGVNTRDELLSSKPNPPREVTIELVRSFGDIAIATSTAELPSGTRVRALQEWVKRDGRWQLLAHQGAAIAPAGQAATSDVAGTTGTSTTPMRASAPTLSSDDERAVWKAQTDLHKAFLAGDTAAYSRLTSDDYIRVNRDGTQQGKREFLETVAANAKQSPGNLETGDVKVTVDGDTARIVMTTWGTLPGGKTDPPQRVTRIFSRRNNQWQQAAAVFTPVAPQ